MWQGFSRAVPGLGLTCWVPPAGCSASSFHGGLVLQIRQVHAPVRAKLRQPGILQGHSLQGRCRTVLRTPPQQDHGCIILTPCKMQHQATPDTSLRERLTRHRCLQAGQLLWLELPKEAAHHLRAPSTSSATPQSLLDPCKHNHEGADRARFTVMWQKHSPLQRFTSRLEPRVS